jgi:hypothetical protein
VRHVIHLRYCKAVQQYNEAARQHGMAVQQHVVTACWVWLVEAWAAPGRSSLADGVTGRPSSADKKEKNTSQHSAHHVHIQLARCTQDVQEDGRWGRA